MIYELVCCWPNFCNSDFFILLDGFPPAFCTFEHSFYQSQLGLDPIYYNKDVNQSLLIRWSHLLMHNTFLGSNYQGQKIDSTKLFESSNHMQNTIREELKASSRSLNCYEAIWKFQPDAKHNSGGIKASPRSLTCYEIWSWCMWPLDR